MTKELDKHEDATSTEGAASSPDKNQAAEAAPKRRTPLLVAMACVLALVAGIGLWGAQAAKETPALTTVAKQETSASANVAKTKDKSKASTSASSGSATSASASAAATKATQSAKQESAVAASGPTQPAPQAESTPAAAPAPAPEKQAEPASSTQETPKETVTEVTVTTTPVDEVPTETVVTLSEPAPDPEPVAETVVEPEPTSANVSVLVDGSAAGGGVRDASVEIAIGASVYDALLASGANVNARGTAYGTYVAAIDGLAELEHGPMSGWVYAVNGVQPQTACSNYRLKDGDSIVWTYVNVE
ncbi:MAG: DUF4430 domain-containing protein [Coriobacteriales bacterium]|nr:DUF4430 domain-containing protein [Coriobacteriales bacterium]